MSLFNLDLGYNVPLDYYDMSIPSYDLGGGVDASFGYAPMTSPRGLDFTLTDDRSVPGAFLPNADGTSSFEGGGMMRTPTFDLNGTTVEPLGWRSADGIGIEDISGDPVRSPSFGNFNSNLASGASSGLARLLKGLASGASDADLFDPRSSGGGGTSPIGIAASSPPGAVSVPAPQTGSLMIPSPAMPEFRPMAMDTKIDPPPADLRGLEKLFRGGR
jgi:hypothetical protein